MISFITVAHDNPEQVRRLVDTLISRTSHLKEREIIVIDIGSFSVPDLPEEVRLIPIASSGYKEVYYGRNVGAQLANGDYFVFLSSDITPSGNMVQTIESMREKYGDQTLLVGLVKVVGTAGNVIDKLVLSDHIHCMGRFAFEFINGYDERKVGDTTTIDWCLFVDRFNRAGFGVKEHYNIGATKPESELRLIATKLGTMEEGFRMTQTTTYDVDLQRYREINAANTRRIAELEAQLEEARSLNEQISAIQEESQMAVATAEARAKAAELMARKEYEKGYNDGEDNMATRRKEALEEVERTKAALDDERRKHEEARANATELNGMLSEQLGRVEELKAELQTSLAKLEEASQKKKGFWSFGK